MRSRIEAADLVEAAAAFLKEAESELSGRTAFHAKVAANALAIVVRELREHPSEAEAAALGALLPDVAAEARVAEACARIRAGEWTAETPGLLDALEAGVRARLAVDNPRFSTLQRLRGA
ncbi:DUF6285 domain-containing protein [Sphingosinicella microcystinivorans]|uniref:DUF6285 domain-containing protein n=1 Tax=Sphingosinicella microcystinivorans TaxID=335406 RepID=A0AAD1G2E4_SPHMI|nr:DUF6285 domain-containing protein [Sphingosinicella microcystinivorans]RKS87947.1 hypothetical protein DFR51_2593 [Sphingosinicella microcystinivorans]BBE35758.1 hypothetical protein SmB9_34160 [Sphingosinicella microcystinivorans]